MSSSEAYRDVGEAAWGWVLRQVQDDDGPWLPDVVAPRAVADGPLIPPPLPSPPSPPTPPDDRDSLYSGIAGLAPVLAEIHRSRPWSTRERDLASDVVARLSARAADRIEPSLYDGLAGDVTALRLLAPGTEQVALQRLADLSTSAGWDTTLDVEPGSTAPLTDLVMGTAGVVLAAVWAGGATSRGIAVAGAEALLRVAEPTAAGLDWRLHPTYRSSCPNYSHGTAGVAAALAVAGQSLERADLVDAATNGALHLLSVGSLEGDGFVVPHTIPPARREVEPVTYGWCHGPTGTSQLFAALALAGVDEVGGYDVGDLRRRCLHSVLTSGAPERLRPGFWDNDGRCCGTAGVGDVLLDAAQDCRSATRAEALLRAARTMGDALIERVVRDDTGARWRFVEHRQDPPLLSPGTSWMQGAAGIAAFLFRLARVVDVGLRASVVDRPDQWWAVPADVRTAAVARR